MSDETTSREEITSEEPSDQVAVTEEPELPVDPNQIEAIFDNQGGTHKVFGTFTGVFRPTILTILGVMMYLREGWLVGNGGLLGAVLVILACYLITGATALSISSITTNIRVGSGGVFSIISMSLGLEVGGSVGIPLYLAQGLSAALYMQGIIETWVYLFPEHHFHAVLGSVFIISFLVAWFGARLAFRVQLGVMVLTILALGSIFLGARVNPIQAQIVWWGAFEEADLSLLFAVFFPAATGIMVGSSLSGSLRKPRRSIPIGTMAAWGCSLLVYLACAVWYALMGTPEELMDTDKIFAVEKALWGPMVLVGVIASCFSATLSSLVAAPRVLQALAVHGVVPFRGFFERQYKGDPRNATLITGLIVLTALLLGDLNTIASILTIFFLVIYFVINLVLLIEHRLKMISFRPQFPISPMIPLIGALTCITAILIISPTTGLLAIAITIAIYFYLDQKQLETPWETVNSGIFTGIAFWAAKKVLQTKQSTIKRSWKPDLLIPVRDDLRLEGDYRMIRALVYPRGSVEVASFHKGNRLDELRALVAEFQQDGVFASCSVIEDRDFLAGMRTCLSVKASAFFGPNTLFTSIEHRSQEELQELVAMARANDMGVVLLGHHPESGLGRERSVNLWVRDQSPDWQLGLKLANLDTAVLMSYQLAVNWGARIRALTVVEDRRHIELARIFLLNLVELARLTDKVDIQVAHGQFTEQVGTLPRADINIFGLSETVDKVFLESLIQQTRGSCLFVLDSENVSALA